MNQERALIWAITIIFTVSLIIGLWVTYPDDYDIQACMEATNYSAERCEFELTK